MKPILFLDLEETIIDSWHSGFLINVHTIRDFVKTLGVTEIGIFSFAVWNDVDIEVFNNSFRSPIMEALEVDIIKVPSVEQINREIFWKKGTHLSTQEVITIWGKDKSFHDWIVATSDPSSNPERIILVDDVVRNTTIIERDLNLTIELVNINSLRTLDKFPHLTAK